jgi:hypothetical protein
VYGFSIVLRFDPIPLFSLSSLYRTAAVQVLTGADALSSLSEPTLQVSQNHSDNSSRAKMSFQKPEKDFGEGPVCLDCAVWLRAQLLTS